MQNIIVTGASGFIGYHLCKKLIEEKYKVIGIDNLNNYYSKKLKLDRLAQLKNSVKNNRDQWRFYNGSIEDKKFLNNIFEIHKPEIVFNLAAQAGVRYSLINPNAYIQSNILGFLNILECSRTFATKNLIYGSSSSVYGGNIKTPFSEDDPVNHPVSIYASTKRSNELMAHTYSHLYNLPCIGLRFFTVYGPWGRPDMAPMIFTKSIIDSKPIKIFNHGNMFRDFTYIDDVVEVLVKLIHKPAKPDPLFNRNSPNPSTSWAPHRVFNVGNSQPINLLEFISKLEDEIGIKAIKEFVDMQPGDVQTTSSNNFKINEWVEFKPNTNLSFGIKKFVKWYRDYFD